MGTVLVTILVGLVIAVVIGGLIIMLATRVVAGFMPSFAQACIAALVAAIAAGILNWLVAMALGASGTTTSIVCLVLVFLLNSAIINAIVRRPGGAALGFGTACLISLVQIVVEIIIAVLIGIMFGAAVLSMMGPMH